MLNCFFNDTRKKIEAEQKEHLGQCETDNELLKTVSDTESLKIDT